MVNKKSKKKKDKFHQIIKFLNCDHNFKREISVENDFVFRHRLNYFLD